MWVLAGILSFTVLEMALPGQEEEEEQPQKTPKLKGVVPEEERNGNYIHSMSVLNEKHLAEVTNRKNNNNHCSPKEKAHEKRVSSSHAFNFTLHAWKITSSRPDTFN